MKQHEIQRLACEGRLFVLSCCCTFDIEQVFLKVGQTYGNHVLRESIMLLAISAVSSFMSPAPMATYIHLLTAFCIKPTTLQRAACLLRHSISSFTDTLWETTPLQHGWKMILMLHLCLTSFFFQARFLSAALEAAYSLMCVLPSALLSRWIDVDPNYCLKAVKLIRMASFFLRGSCLCCFCTAAWEWNTAKC